MAYHWNGQMSLGGIRGGRNAGLHNINITRKHGMWFADPHCTPVVPQFSTSYKLGLTVLKLDVKENTQFFTWLVKTGLPVVLKFLKFHSCPEIVLKSAIVLKFYSFGQNVWIWTFVMLSLHFFYKSWLMTTFVCVADVECQVMFSLVTLYCFMCNIALVTFLGLQYWSVICFND